MKSLLHGFVFLFIFCSFSAFAQSPDPNLGFGRFDTLLSKTWENGTWVNQSRIFNTYNTDCNTNSSTFQSWANSIWGNNIQSTYTYLPSKKVNQSFVSQWIDPAWVVFGRTTNTYNAALQLTKDLTEIYSGLTWIGGSQNLYTYSNNGYLITEVGQTWNGTQFENSTRTDYTNNSGGIVISERTQNWSGGLWVNSDSTHYVYTGTNQILSSISFDWIGNQWVNSSRTTGTYLNNLLTQLVDQDWVNNAWVNSGRFTLTYGGNQRLISLLEQSWDVASQNWINMLLDEISYTSVCGALPLTLLNFDAEVKPGQVILKWETTNEINTSGFTIQKSTDGLNFNAIGNVPSIGGKTINKYSFEDPFQNGQSGILYYRLLMLDNDGKSALSDVAKVQVDSRGSLALFPNPVRNQLMFVMPKTISNADVRIINQNGSTVINQKFGNITGGARNTIDVSVLPKGLYMIQITDGNKISTKKFMKQ